LHDAFTAKQTARVLVAFAILPPGNVALGKQTIVQVSFVQPLNEIGAPCHTWETYVPLRARRREIPKDGGKKVRVLSIPAIRDRVVQGALKLILEPVFEADFQPGSYELIALHNSTSWRAF
jgi:hypothetical protein